MPLLRCALAPTGMDCTPQRHQEQVAGRSSQHGSGMAGSTLTKPNRGRRMGVGALGPGIQGNRVIGKTDDGQFLNPIDAKTLAIVDDKDKDLSVRPEHIHFALRELAGIDEHPFSEKFPLVIPQPDRLERLLG